MDEVDMVDHLVVILNAFLESVFGIYSIAGLFASNRSKELINRFHDEVAAAVEGAEHYDEFIADLGAAVPRAR